MRISCTSLEFRRQAGILLALTVILPSMAFSATFRKGPYLICPDTNSQMKILWQADSNPAQSYVEWWSTNNFVTNSSGPLSSPINFMFSHTVSNLAPVTRYYYRVTVDSAQEAGSFMTAPGKSANSVVIYGWGDTRSYPTNMDAIARQMITDINADPDRRQSILLHSGDWISNGNSTNLWNTEFFNRSCSNSLGLMECVPIMGARGNHENAAESMRLFWPYDYQADPGCYYSFDYGPIHVVTIDQYVNYSAGSAQYNWISNDLAANAGKWIIVQLHEPPWGAGTHANNTTTQNELCPLFEKYGVALVHQGHNHNYARCLVNGINYMTVGGGGAPLYDPTNTYPYVVTCDKSYQFARYDLSGKQMTVTVIRTNASVIETFMIDGPGMYALNTGGATDFSCFSATLRGEVARTDGDNPEVWVFWGMTDGGTNKSAWSGTNYVGIVSEGPISTLVTNLLPGTSYYYRCYATNSAYGEAWAGSAATFRLMPLIVNSGVVGTEFTNVNVSSGSVWKYLDNGSDQGTNWTDPGFDDSGWASGPAELGYGDGGEATVVYGGPDPTNKYITTYFRHAFVVTNAAFCTNAMVRLLRDDGGVVYLNGHEIDRDSMPGGTITYTTLAFGTSSETAFFDTVVGTNYLVEGTNVLAVEIHQSSITSSDISFDCEYITYGLERMGYSANLDGTLVSTGAAPTEVYVFWGTNDGGTTMTAWTNTGYLGFQVQGAVCRTNVTDLEQATTYYYRYYATNSYGGVWAGASTMFTTFLVDSDFDGMPDSWEMLLFGSLTNMNASSDGDNDGFSDLSEYIAGTDPTNDKSLLVVTAVSNQPAGFVIFFMTETNRFYGVNYANDMLGTNWSVLTNNIPGNGGIVSVEDPEDAARRFYRVKARMIRR